MKHAFSYLDDCSGIEKRMNLKFYIKLIAVTNRILNTAARKLEEKIAAIKGLSDIVYSTFIITYQSRFDLINYLNSIQYGIRTLEIEFLSIDSFILNYTGLYGLKENRKGFNKVLRFFSSILFLVILLAGFLHNA